MGGFENGLGKRLETGAEIIKPLGDEWEMVINPKTGKVKHMNRVISDDPDAGYELSAYLAELNLRDEMSETSDLDLTDFPEKYELPPKDKVELIRALIAVGLVVSLKVSGDGQSEELVIEPQNSDQAHELIADLVADRPLLSVQLPQVSNHLDSRKVTSFTQSEQVIEAEAVVEHVKTTNDGVGSSAVETKELQKEVDLFAKIVGQYKEKYSDAQIAQIKEFADRKVRGAEQYTRQEYVEKAVQFAEWNPETGEGVPPAVAEELRSLMTGWVSEESKYDASSVSKAGALGIFQTMPEVWEHFGGKEGEHISLQAQLRVFGKIVSAFYTYVTKGIGKANLAILRSRFENDEDFERQCVAPIIVNAYQTGTGRMAEAVRLYVENTEVEDMPEGRALFIDIVNFAERSRAGKYLKGFKTHSVGYVPKIYAQRDRLREASEKAGTTDDASKT